MAGIRRFFSEKREEFAIEAFGLFQDLRENLGIRSLERVRVLNRYDIEGISDEEYRQVRQSIFCEPPLDLGYDERFLLAAGEQAFAIEYLPGQYDQRADSAAQCVQLLTHRAPPNVATARVIVLCGPLSAEEVRRVKSYLINPVDSHEAGMAKPETLALTLADPLPVERLTGFIHLGGDGLSALRASLGLAMDLEDLLYCQRYFRERESRDPTITEIRMLDTYWSDHCRHTTFLTHIRSVQIPPGPYSRPLVEAYRVYLQAREFVHGDTGRPICLMDIAQMGMREQAKRGLLPDLDSSDEINACSITIGVDVEGRTEEWLLMFKNETHNHPTEIEPFGGAATCLGGAIRDPLSGRAYVYQAMRLTGSGDPRTPVKETLPGKLPQRKITREAARGYSSYGNQVGLATGKVTEVYDEGYVAKRMEVGAVIGAVPRADVVRGKPAAGDCILLVGGATGRDGIGGATGSSKAHTEASIRTCGAEVQKGNPVIERKIQRLFRNRLATRLIKRCNDFGAGGVSVAVGELAEGLDIDLDAIPKKYEGLDGTELALSESQERMAVMVEAVDVEPFRRLATEENLEATPIARVTADRRLRMHWRGDTIVDIGRDFLDSAGVRRHTDVWAPDPEAGENPFRHPLPAASRLLPDLKAAWLALLADPNLCDQHGLVEQFDSSIGRGTVLFPYGGLYQATPAEGMAARIPLLEGKTSTATVMTHGFDPRLSRWSPFHGGFYAVVEAAARMVACGADHTRIRLSLQEYFEKPGSDPRRWGKPFAALLGAYFAQKQLGIAAIGGKDSMSGSFKELDVPPTLAAFAVTPVDSEQVMSPEFKEPGSRVVLLSAERDEDEMPDTERLAATFKRVFRLRSAGVVRSAISLRGGGLAAALSLMALGNRIGLRLDAPLDAQRLFFPDWGSLVVEIPASEEPRELFSGIGFLELGRTVAEPKIEGGGISISLAEIEEAWEGPLAGIFPPRGGPRLLEKPQAIPAPTYAEPTPKRAAVKVARPRVLITVMPGTNCEYDTARAFALAGAVPDTLVFRNLTPAMIEESLEALVSRLGNSQILVIPGGFSAGDEPEGSGKFLTAVFRNRRAQDAVARFIERGDGLILGICNGFQALVKLGLLPDERIRELTDASPTLTFNGLGRFVSRLVRTRVVSTLSPWFSLCQVGDIHIVPVAHGEGRFIASSEQLEALASRGQVATQYVDLEGRPAPASDGRFNPNGSYWAVEAISSPDGRILGRMAHPERVAEGLFRNIPGMVESPVFRSGVHYFS